MPRVGPRLFDPMREGAGAIAIAGLMLAPTLAAANPHGAQVVHGNVQINAAGPALNITNSPGAIINWQHFGIDPGEITRFMQQGAHSAVLNRVVGANPSAILGALQSNGQVFLINPNGVVFGAGAVVDTAGLVVSTLDMRNEDFIAGRLRFAGSGAEGTVVNAGAIRSTGSVVLIAPRIENSGLIEADGGLLLAAGREVTLTSLENPEVAFIVQAPENEALNLGRLASSGGAASVFAGSIRHSGEIDASAITLDAQGRVQLVAQRDVTLEAGSTIRADGAGDGGAVRVQSATGTVMASGAAIDARGEAGRGGDVRLLGEQVGLAGDTRIDASGRDGGGQVLIGGDYQGANPEVANARATFMGNGTRIAADASTHGDGGRVILWADDVTRAHGTISARGGPHGGDGGFVEISGKHALVFEAFVDTRAPRGRAGTLLLDPDTIEIINGGGGSADGSLPVFNNLGGGATTISELSLEAQAANVALQAADGITLRDLADDQLNMNLLVTGESFTLQTTGSGDIVFEDPNDEIFTAGADIVIQALGGGSLDLGEVRSLAGIGGDITLIASAGNVTLRGAVVSNGTTRGDVEITAGGSIASLGAGSLFANKLKLTAADGIDLQGANNIPQLTADNVSSGNIVFANFGGPLTLSNNGTAFAVRNQAAGGRVEISSGGDIVIDDQLISADAMTLDAGADIDQNTAAAVITASVLEVENASTVSLNATTNNIGGLIGTNIGVIALVNNSGGVALALNDIDATGNIAITNSGGLSVTGTVDSGVANSIILLEQSNDINGAGGQLTGGVIDLTSAGGIGNGTVLTTNFSSFLTLNSAPGGNIHIARSGALSTSNIALNAPFGAPRTIVIENTLGTTTVDSAFGNINDHLVLKTLNGGMNHVGAGLLVGQSVTLESSATIGNTGGASIKTQTGSLSAAIDPLSGGSIFIDNTGAVTVQGISTPGAGVIHLNQNAGTGAVTIAGAVNAGSAGPILINSDSDLSVNADVLGVSNITLTSIGPATNVITIAPGASVHATGIATNVVVNSNGSVVHDGTVQSDQGDVSLVASAGYTMGAGGVGRATNGDVTLLSAGNAALGLLDAPAGVVSVSSTTGLIGDANGAANNVTASSADFNAVNGIGTLTDPIETAIATLTGASTTNASVAIANTGALTVSNSISTAAGGSILLTGSGGLTLGGLNILSGNEAILGGGSGTLQISNSLVNANTGLSASAAIIDVLSSILNGDDVNMVASGAVSIKTPGAAASVNAGNNASVTAGSLLVEGGAAAGASAKIDAANAVIVDAGSVTVLGGAGTGAFASIDPVTAIINTTGDITVQAGSGGAADIIAASLVTLNAGGDVNVIGSNQPALIEASGGNIFITAANVNLIAGVDPAGDALLFANSGAGNVNVTAAGCVGCAVLASDPFANALAEAGVFGLLAASVAPAPPAPAASVADDGTDLSTDEVLVLEELGADLLAASGDSGADAEEDERFPVCS